MDTDRKKSLCDGREGWQTSGRKVGVSSRLERNNELETAAMKIGVNGMGHSPDMKRVMLRH